jgi:hypothetical protein
LLGRDYITKYQPLITTQHTLVCSPSSGAKIGNLQLEANTSAPAVPASSGLDNTYNQMKAIIILQSTHIFTVPFGTTNIYLSNHQAKTDKFSLVLHQNVTP